MLSELSYSRLQEEIHFLRIDLNNLAVELNIRITQHQQIYQTFYNPAETDRIWVKIALYNWKKTRLEALELFARAQFSIAEMQQPVPVQPTYTNRIYKRKRRTKNKACAIGPSGDPKFNSVPQNMVNKRSNKENQAPPSTQALTSQDRTNRVKNGTNEDERKRKEIKLEDSKANIAQSIADTLKNLKKENIHHDQISVLNNNVNANFIPQLLPVANVKVERVDCN